MARARRDPPEGGSYHFTLRRPVLAIQWVGDRDSLGLIQRLVPEGDVRTLPDRSLEVFVLGGKPAQLPIGLVWENFEEELPDRTIIPLNGWLVRESDGLTPYTQTDFAATFVPVV